MCVLLMLLSLSVDMKFANAVFNVHNGGQNLYMHIHQITLIESSFVI